MIENTYWQANNNNNGSFINDLSSYASVFQHHNSNYDDSYHKPLARNGLTSLSGNRKGIKKTKVNK